MKILDEITNEVINERNAIRIDLHPYKLSSNTPTIDSSFERKTMYVSKTTANNILKVLDEIAIDIAGVKCFPEEE